MAIDGINVENWRAKPLKEIVNNLDVVEEEDSECAQWAQAMAAVANAPDNVTYDMTGGSVEEFTAELDKITENGGLPEEEKPEDGTPEDVDGVGKPDEVPPEEEEPDVGDVDDTTEEDPEAEAEAATANAPTEETPPEEDPVDEGEEDDDPLADEGLTTDDETIRKRKAKRGDPPAE